jgi:hypothetical protein
VMLLQHGDLGRGNHGCNLDRLVGHLDQPWIPSQVCLGRCLVEVVRPG